MSESIFLDKKSQGGNVFVSDARVILSEKTYTTANITSVSTYVREQLFMNIQPILLAPIIGIIAYMILPQQSASTIKFVGMLAIATYFISSRLKKKYYIVMLGSSSGENEALQSENKALIESIVEAINQAIIHRANSK